MLITLLPTKMTTSKTRRINRYPPTRLTLSILFGLAIVVFWRNYHEYDTTLKFSPVGTRQKLPIEPISPWYRTMLEKQDRKCKHTSTFFHYFLPHVECVDKVRVGKCDDGAKWICRDFFQGKNTKRAIAKKEKCVVYSFGSSDDSCFESAMADMFDCEIHIFDPTSGELRNPRWTYHGYGIGGKNSEITDFWNCRTQKRDTCTNCPMKDLKTIMKELGHTHLDVLKVDVDGAEWRSFQYIYEEMKSLPADQLQLELTGLDVSSKNDSLAEGLSGAHRLWENILLDGFKIFNVEFNMGTCSYRDKDRSVSTEYALSRLPDM